MKQSVYFCFLNALLLTVTPSCLLAQDGPAAYVSSSLIEVEALEPAREKALTEFVAKPLKYQKRTSITSLLCKPIITRPTPAPEQLQLPLALVETELSTELFFERPLAGEEKEKATNSFSIEFDKSFVTIRASKPRYQSQSGGLRIMYPAEITEGTFYEGKKDTDVLFLVPPVTDCGLQFVVACPRAYSNSRTLEESPLSLTGVRFFPFGKADGLFKSPQNTEGKVRASLRATSRVTAPQNWFSENSSTDTPSAGVKLPRLLDMSVSDIPATPITPPFSDAFEARLEFGTKDSPLRTVTTRSTVDVRPLTLQSEEVVRVENSDVPVKPGSCFVISRRKETHY